VLSRSTFEYPTPGAPFRVQRIDLDGRTGFTATGHELMVCVEGAAPPLATGTAVHVGPGEDVELHGCATLFRISPT
jgi:mannose-6-phosphate isomerase class I